MKTRIVSSVGVVVLGLIAYWMFQSSATSEKLSQKQAPTRGPAAVEAPVAVAVPQKVDLKKLPQSDPQAVAKILVSLKTFLSNLSDKNRREALNDLMNYPLEGMRVLHQVLSEAPFTEPNQRVQLLSLGIDLLEQVNHEISTMDRVSLAGIEIHKLAEQTIRHELSAPEWVEFQQASKVTQTTLDNLEHSGEIYNQEGQWVKPTLPAKVMSLQLAARLPVGQQMGVSYHVSELNDGSRSQEVLTQVSKDLLGK